MQENAHPPAVGLAATIEREQGFMNQVMEWKGFAGTASRVRGRLLVEASHPPAHYTIHERPAGYVGASWWRSGKIVHEWYDGGTGTAR